MKNVFRGFSIVIFVIGVVAFSQVPREQNNEKDSDVETAKSHVVTYVQSNVSPDKTIAVTGWRTRYVKPNGEWRLVLHKTDPHAASPGDSNGNKPRSNSTVYGELQDGVYGKAAGADVRDSFSPPIDNQIRESLDKRNESFRSHQFLKNHPGFVRVDYVAGLKVYILRAVINDATNPQVWTEISYSPKTGRTPIRNITHFRDGSEIRIEAISIEFKDVPEDLNEDLKVMPINGKAVKPQ